MATLSPLARYIHDARKAAALSQAALGESIGVTKGNVSAWENDRHEPSISQLKKIAAITMVPIPSDVIGPRHDAAAPMAGPVDVGHAHAQGATVQTAPALPPPSPLVVAAMRVDGATHISVETKTALTQILKTLLNSAARDKKE